MKIRGGAREGRGGAGWGRRSRLMTREGWGEAQERKVRKVRRGEEREGWRKKGEERRKEGQAWGGEEGRERDGLAFHFTPVTKPRAFSRPPGSRPGGRRLGKRLLLKSCSHRPVTLR